VCVVCVFFKCVCLVCLYSGVGTVNSVFNYRAQDM